MQNKLQLTGNGILRLFFVTNSNGGRIKSISINKSDSRESNKVIDL